MTFAVSLVYQEASANLKLPFFTHLEIEVLYLFRLDLDNDSFHALK
jgi:hypothetical protein